MPWAVPIKPTSTYQHGVVTLQNPTRHEIEDGRPYTPHRLNQAMFSGQLFVSDNQSSDLVRKKPVHVEQVKVEAEKLSPIRVAQKSANHQVSHEVVVDLLGHREYLCCLAGKQITTSRSTYVCFTSRDRA
uniref:Transposase n=1 Tax=Mesocestoides corti TaxID=53468 RepID=A0A5K3G1N4_MESCO